MEQLLKLPIEDASCEEIMNHAFDTHPECYVSAGFCKDIALSLKNLIALLRVFDLRDALSLRFLKQVSVHRFVCVLVC